MDYFKEGSVIKLSNEKDYIVFATIKEQENQYSYVMTTTEPLEILFVKQYIENDSLKFAIVNDPNEKQHALELFKEAYRQQPSE